MKENEKKRFHILLGVKLQTFIYTTSIRQVLNLYLKPNNILFQFFLFFFIIPEKNENPSEMRTFAGDISSC